MIRMLRILLWMAIAAAMAFGLWMGKQSLSKWVGGGDSALQKRIAVSTPSVVYLLKKGRWLEMSLAPETDMVRLVTNASISSTLATKPMDVWQYAFRYQVLDDDGKVVLDNVYHSRTGVTKISDPKSGEQFTPSFYLEPGLTPTEGQIMQLNLVGIPRVSKLRISLASMSSPLKDIALRAYFHEKVPERKLAFLWQRMYEDKKKALSKGNIYSHEMLLEQEVRNLLSQTQRPISPSGIEGRSYHSRVLYTMTEYEGQQLFEPVIPAGLWIDSQHHGVVPIPEEGGNVRLDFARASTAANLISSSPIHIRWYGKGPKQRADFSVDWTGKPVQFSQNFEGGLLEILASDSIVVRAYQADLKEKNEITPEPMYLREYLMQDNAAVEYQVSHTGNQSTPVRVDFRYIVPPMPALPDEHLPVVEYNLLDAQGELIKQGTILIYKPASIYERVVGDVNGMILSDPSTYYFSLPANVAKIRFKSDNPAMVVAYNRPADLVHLVKVPESSYVSDLDDWNQPAWFPVRPVEYQGLILGNRSMLITLQHRPPEDKPDLMAGRYLWEDYHPQGAWLARHLFTPIEDMGLMREEAFPSIYRLLISDKEQGVNLRAIHGVSYVMPGLAYFRQGKTPFEIKFFVDGKLHFKTMANGNQGEIQLPALSVAHHSIKVSTSSPAKFYLNYSEPQPGALLKRLGNRLGKKNMSFVYERTSHCEETLSLRLHVPFGVQERSIILMRMKNITPIPFEPLTGWSFWLRRYDVRPDRDYRVPVMGTNGEMVDRGQSFFIPLGAELPPGKYRLYFTLEQGSEGYLTMSRVTPGIFRERKIYQESEVRNVETIE